MALLRPSVEIQQVSYGANEQGFMTIEQLMRGGTASVRNRSGVCMMAQMCAEYGIYQAI